MAMTWLQARPIQLGPVEICAWDSRGYIIHLLHRYGWPCCGLHGRVHYEQYLHSTYPKTLDKIRGYAWSERQVLSFRLNVLCILPRSDVNLECWLDKVQFWMVHSHICMKVLDTYGILTFSNHGLAVFRAVNKPWKLQLMVLCARQILHRLRDKKQKAWLEDATNKA